MWVSLRTQTDWSDDDEENLTVVGGAAPPMAGDDNVDPLRQLKKMVETGPSRKPAAVRRPHEKDSVRPLLGCISLNGFLHSA